MVSSPDAPNPAPPRRPRSRWFWGTIVAVLALWLGILLTQSKPGVPAPTKAAAPPGIDPRAAAALSRWRAVREGRELRVRRPSGPVPPGVDGAESK